MHSCVAAIKNIKKTEINCKLAYFHCWPASFGRANRQPRLYIQVVSERRNIQQITLDLVPKHAIIFSIPATPSEAALLCENHKTEPGNEICVRLETIRNIACPIGVGSSDMMKS